ncbi:hypothetical protein HRbin30_00420 [bacterium HR30]|nr:hypothetical protein HRbin30_00420 [bacterium HR30]
MTQRLFAFVQALRSQGIDISPAEVLDAFRGVQLLGVERFILKETLAACLVKTTEHRPTFEALFEQFFPLLLPAGRPRQKRRRQHHLVTTGGRNSGRRPYEDHSMSLRPRPSRRQRPVQDLLREYDRRARAELVVPALSAQRSNGTGVEEPGHADPHKQLFHRPWTALDFAGPEDFGPALRKMVEIFRRRLGRRRKRTNRGTLHFRATFRKAVSTAGLLARPVFHRKHPRDLNLVALCDMSHSVANATKFFLHLLAAAQPYFRRALFLAFVDRAVELEVGPGHVQPLAPLDVYARSDFGNVLATVQTELLRSLDRNTLLLILGDGRNNHRPPRAEILRDLRHRSRAVLWVQPEDPTRWGTGDSAFLHYAPHCTHVVVAPTPQELLYGLTHALFRYV